MEEQPLVNPLISSLLEHGKKLSTLFHHEVKTREDLDKKRSQIINETQQALESIKNRNSTLLPYSFDESIIIPKILIKLQATLDEFDKLDPDNVPTFQDLKKKIDNLRRSMELSNKPSASDTPRVEDDDNYNPPREDDYIENEDDSAYNSLKDNEKDCLLFCGELLSYYENHKKKEKHKEKDKEKEKDEQKENDKQKKKDKEGLSKRELIHWWIGLDFIKNPDEGEQLVAELVHKKLITFTSSRASETIPRKFNTGYIVNARIPSKVKGEKKLTTLESQNKTLVVSIKDDNKEKRMVMAINRSVSTLNSETLLDGTGFHKDNKVEILHLGKWPYIYKKNVVVEEIESLKSFMKHTCQHLTTLSLQGVGGIIQLPESVYQITTIKVLDLKACPNLEILPEGISSMKNLTSFDVSECYLLSYIPKGIGSLSKLMVIKGFIINSKKHKDKECGFDELENLENLIKLAIRARKTGFPRNEDLKTISKMEKLRKLKITWVQQTSSGDDDDDDNDSTNGNKLPRTLKKLELIAAPDKMALVLLDLISYKSSNCPEKVYIRGGELWKLDPELYCFPNVEVLRFRYLRQLHLKWLDCQQLFPKLSQLEVFQCPNLVFFPCNDKGLWIRSEDS